MKPHVNHLHDGFYKAPQKASMMMSNRQLHETLMATGGVIVAKGNFWKIKHEHLGAGANKVTIEQR